MSRHALATLVAVLVGVGSLVFIYTQTQAPTYDEVDTASLVQEPPVLSEPTLLASALVEEYLREKINVLSPERAVLGGTFYVTEVVFPSDGSAVVYYEDGHIALVADVAYEITAEQGVLITSFVVRSEEGAAPPIGEKVSPKMPAAGGGLCTDRCGNRVCEEVVCMAEGCPCAESVAACPADCSGL